LKALRPHSSYALKRIENPKQISLADRAREEIHRAILDGALAPGDPISIGRVAEELGIGRTPVRDALKALDREGLVSVDQARGTEVRRVPLEELSHRFAARSLLEGLAAQLACESQGPAFAEQLEENCAQVRLLTGQSREEVQHHVELNRQFHRAIYDGCESPLVRGLLDGLQNPRPFSEYLLSDPERRAASVESHEAIAGAIRAEDPEMAALLMRQHIHDSTLFALDRHEDYYGHWPDK
jgi:DNA-binding GntR family transcriptional regulator